MKPIFFLISFLPFLVFGQSDTSANDIQEGIYCGGVRAPKEILNRQSVYFEEIGIQPEALRGQLYFEDTINQINEEGRKNGLWVVYGHMKPSKNYRPNSIIEQGYYKEGRRVGVWYFHYYDGWVKSISNFKSGRITGVYYKFYRDGVIKEKGELIYGRAVNTKVTFDPSGCKEMEYFFSKPIGRTDSVYIYSETICDSIIEVSIIPPKERSISICSPPRQEKILKYKVSASQIQPWYGNPVDKNFEFFDSLHFSSKKLYTNVEELDASVKKSLENRIRECPADVVYIDFYNAEKRKGKWFYTYYVFKRRKEN